MLCVPFEVKGPVEEVGSVPVFVDPVGKVKSPVAAVEGVQAMEVLILEVRAAAVSVSAVEVICPASEVKNSLLHLRPESKTDSAGEVKCSVVEVMFFDILSITSATRGDMATEVIVSAVECTGSVVKVCPGPEDPVAEAPNSPLTSLGLSATWLMGHGVSGLTTGMTGDVGSGLVPGLIGYGVSNRLPEKKIE